MDENATPTVEHMVAEFCSGDPHLVWRASWDAARCWDRSVLQRLSTSARKIEKATRGLELGGLLSPNSAVLEFALKKMRFAAETSNCLCELYCELDRFDPSAETSAGRVITIEETIVPYATVSRCRCITCGAEYHVQEGDYHFTWWAWTRV